MQLKHSHKTLIQGFTLLELMISISIFGILISLAVPNVNAFIQKQSLRTNVQKVNALMISARSLAITELTDVRVCWNSTAGDITNSGVTISPGEMVSIRPLEATVANRLANRINYQSALLLYVEADADNCIEFDSDGRAKEALAFAVCKSATDKKHSAGLTVSLQGRIFTEGNENDEVISC